MERIALQNLMKWNMNKRKKPLIVWGARQVGKTYLVKDIFAETYYKDNYIYIDFKKEDDVREFCEKTANAEKIIEYLSLFKAKQITENTLLMKCRNAPTSYLLLNIFAKISEKFPLLQPVQWFVSSFKEKPKKEVQRKTINSCSLWAKSIKLLSIL